MAIIRRKELAKNVIGPVGLEEDKFKLNWQQRRNGVRAIAGKALIVKRLQFATLLFTARDIEG